MPLWLALLVPPAAAQDLAPWDPGTWSADEDRGFVLPDGPVVDDGDGVVGGTKVKRGDWPDAVGIVFAGQYVGCTGTLVGPKVVLTAGHCIGGYPITHVLVGSTDWLTDQGTLVPVERSIEYPNSQGTYDAAVLLLAEAAADYAPREIALECILRDHLEDGAPVQIVGYGVTTETGGGFNSQLNEAPSTVLDKNCDRDRINDVISGCNPAVSPGGEIAAGGNGTDACYGDSGGPLYLRTDRGDYVVGITSRAFLGVNPNYPCRDGGIWVRPDAIIEWLEEQTGARKMSYPSCNEPPDVTAPELVTWQDTAGAVTLGVNDPDGDASAATFAVVVEPEHGTVTLDTAGEVSYVPDPGFVGADSVTIAITDAGNDEWRRTGDPVTIEVDVPILVNEGRPPGACGCSGAGPLGAAWPLGLLGLLATRRRR